MGGVRVEYYIKSASQSARAPERQSARAPERQSARAPERQSARAPERQSARAPERQSARAPERQDCLRPTRRPEPPAAARLTRGTTLYSRFSAYLHARSSPHRPDVRFLAAARRDAPGGVRAPLRPRAAVSPHARPCRRALRRPVPCRRLAGGSRPCLSPPPVSAPGSGGWRPLTAIPIEPRSWPQRCRRRPARPASG